MSGSGSAIRVGDYVRLEVSGEPRKGEIESVNKDKSQWTVRLFKKDGSREDTATEYATAELKRAGMMTFASKDGMSQVIEVALNSLVHGTIQKIRSGPTFGDPFMTFVAADLIYEIFGKQLVDQFIPKIFRPDPVAAAGGFFELGDLQDALKAIPIVILQQIVQKLWKRKSMSHRLLKNVLDAYISVALGNVVGRGVTKMTGGRTGGSINYKW